MRQIRRGVFETNSSSTHSISICTKDEFDRFRKNELVYDYYNDRLIKSNPIAIAADSYEWGVMTYAQLFDDDELEGYAHDFVTPSGDKMVAFGQFGYQG